MMSSTTFFGRLGVPGAGFRFGETILGFRSGGGSGARSNGSGGIGDVSFRGIGDAGFDTTGDIGFDCIEGSLLQGLQLHPLPILSESDCGLFEGRNVPCQQQTRLTDCCT